MSVITEGGRLRAFAWLAAAIGVLVVAALLIAPEVGAAPTTNEIVKLTVPDGAYDWAQSSSGRIQLQDFNGADDSGVYVIMNLQADLPTLRTRSSCIAGGLAP